MVALASAGYGGAALFSVVQLYRPRWEVWALVSAGLGWVSETLWLFTHVGLAMVFLTTRNGTVAVAVWTLVAFFWLAQRSSLKSLGSFLLPVTFALWGIDRVLTFIFPPLMLFAAGWRAHVTWALVLASVVSFVVSAVFAIMYVEKERELKKRRVRLFYYRLPALAVLDRAMGRLAAIGFAIMTAALVVALSGAATIVHPWRLGVLWALGAGVLTVRYHGRWRGPRMASLTMLASLVIVAYLFGAPA